jgi:gamma-glutamyltranspeptidase/glutathione hydrolase
VAEGEVRNVRPGVMQLADLAGYSVHIRPAVETSYRGYTLYGAGPPSGGALGVGLLLHLLEPDDLTALSEEERLHRFIEASRLAFADRNAYVSDPEFFPVPAGGLLSGAYAAERRLAMSPVRASPGAALPGNPFPFASDPSTPPTLPPPPPPPTPPPEPGGDAAEDATLGSTTHITVADAAGNIVAYSCSIEQEGGNGMVVPGYGFLLNNELTNFDVPPTPELPHANVAEPFKRPRSSMSPTLVFREGRPVLALGSPGGATIVTTVAQVLVRVLDLGQPIEEAIAAPRLTHRNLPSGRVETEPELLALPEAAALAARGHRLVQSEPLGAVTALVFNDDGSITAAAEPVRRGGGSAQVVKPRPR